jgi:outer membrane lipoprotein carrier protein
MLRLLLFAACSALAVAQTPLLKEVEKRYNATSTLQANFTETFTDRGRARTPQRGVLYMKKPGRTRWEYTAPAGDLFVSDGKTAYDYDKRKNEADRIPIKETDDMRIPLSFLLGTLDFQKDFERFESKPDGANQIVTAHPRNKKLLFQSITMTIAPDYSIRKVSVLGQEGSTMDYVLEAEQRNVKLADSLFQFTAPAGAQVVDVK